MKICFISPKGNITKDDDLNNFLLTSSNYLFRYFYNGISTGLLILAALTPPSFEIKIIDENEEQINFKEHFDLIVLTAMTQQATRAYFIADEFRRKGTKVVIGGIHASILPEEAKGHTDSVLIGEGEKIWLDFINDFITGDIKPFYKNNDLIDIKMSPIPRYDLLIKYNYKIIWVQATRGCPHNCIFCAASKIFGTKYRRKDIDQVIKEIEYIQNIWSKPQINFADDNIFVDKEYSLKLIERLIPLNIRWAAQTDITTVQDKQFINLLKESGCVSLFIGFETIKEEGLDLINNKTKKGKLTEYSEIITSIQSKGIGILGAFIIGFDTDRVSIFDELANFIIENNLYTAQITILTPLPGTLIREQLEKENRLINTNWDNYTFTNVNFIPKNMTPSELLEGLKQVYKKVYDKKVVHNRMRYFKKIYKDLYLSK